MAYSLKTCICFATLGLFLSQCLHLGPHPKGQKFNYPLARVKGGVFQMGSPELVQYQGRGDDECLHEVSVKSFRMGKYEVTQAQWQLVMGDNPAHHKECPDCPVENITWDQLQEFLQKIRQQTGENYRLPTEQEWEYAAKSGRKSSPVQDSLAAALDPLAWYAENAGMKTHPVGQKRPNALGIYDMQGNVNEWCQDLYGPYPDCFAVGDAARKAYVVRGGCYFDKKHTCTQTYRSFAGKFGNLGMGFRLVLNDEL